MDRKNVLATYTERNISNPFNTLKPDERLIAHWALCFKELLKFNYSSFIGYDLDDIAIEQQMKGLSSDKKGGINYFNYMFSDQYDEKDKKLDDKGKIFGALSVYDALEKYGGVAIGDFICPPDVLAYVKEKRAASDNGIPSSNIPRDEARYENCKKAMEEILRHDKRLQGHPIMCLAGAFWVECGWKFEHVLNTAEASGNGNKGTGGYTNAGESWFGITFWGQKKKIITGMNLPCSSNESNYKPGNMMCDLPFSTQAKIVPWYLENMVPKPGKVLLEFNKGPKTPEQAKQCIGASFVFKAGNWKNSGNWWDDAIDAAMHYTKSVTSAFDGFALQIYMSLMFARYLKDKKVPKGEPWDK